MSRLGAYVIGELQKSLRISQTMRLGIDPDNHMMWARAGDGLRVYPFGMSHDRRTEAPIEITFDYDRDIAHIWVDCITTLIRDRGGDPFDPEKDLPNAPLGEINREVNLIDANELLEIWENVPAKPRETIVNRMPRVVGL